MMKEMKFKFNLKFQAWSYSSGSTVRTCHAGTPESSPQDYITRIWQHTAIISVLGGRKRISGVQGWTT